jgi:molecular chaperone GrpE
MNEEGNSNPRTDETNSNGDSDEGQPKRLSDESDETSATKLEDLEKVKHDYLYLRAEFENFKKHAIKERSDLRKYGCERFAADLLNILDIFETALSSEVTADSIANFRKGIDMTATEMRHVLMRHGVTEIPSHGQPFDPAMHEALSSEETAASPPGTITQVFKKAYKLHDRVIRPGQVVVAKAKS